MLLFFAMALLVYAIGALVDGNTTLAIWLLVGMIGVCALGGAHSIVAINDKDDNERGY